MRVNLNLTKDELEWLEAVTSCGAEITRMILDRHSATDLQVVQKCLPNGDKEKWADVQYGLYRKVRRL